MAGDKSDSAVLDSRGHPRTFEFGESESQMNKQESAGSSETTCLPYKAGLPTGRQARNEDQ